MEVYKLRVDKAIESLENAIEILLKEKSNLELKIKDLNSDNEKLKNLTKSAKIKLDKYIKELEDIRRDHGSSNTSN